MICIAYRHKRRVVDLVNGAPCTGLLFGALDCLLFDEGSKRNT